MNVIKLAEMTGVSKSTIYRALNGDKIKDSTRQRIMDTINENDISFNGFEASYDNRVKLIALVTSQGYRNSASVEILKDKFSENGFTVIEIPVEAVENGSEEIEKYIGKNFRSFIFLGTDMDKKCSDIISLASKIRPVLLIHSKMSGKNIYCITSDIKASLSKAILKLSDDYEHKNFLYCISDKTEYGRNLTHGFEEGINISGLGRNNFCAADCTARTSAVEAITSALRSNPTVTAVITQDEATASAAVAAASMLGLKIPRDITIVGLKSSKIHFNDLGTAYIDTKTETIGDMALTLTVAAINGKKASKHIEIPCSFIQKKSVAKSSVQYSKAI